MTVRDLCDLMVARGDWARVTLNLPMMPNLNDAIVAKGTSFRGGRSAYTEMASQARRSVVVACRMQRIAPIPDGHTAWFWFRWIESRMTRDPDNIAAAEKWVLDGLRDAGVLRNDGWKHVAAPDGVPTLAHSFEHRRGESSGVAVDIYWGASH